MLLDGCPTGIFWADTKKYELFNNRDEQLGQGLISDNLYAFLYDSALISKRPSRLFVSFHDVHSNQDQIASIPPECTLGEFVEFLNSVKALVFIDIPIIDFDSALFAFLALLGSYLYKSVFFGVFGVICAFLSFTRVKTESIDAVVYRYRMAKLADNALKVDDTL